MIQLIGFCRTSVNVILFVHARAHTLSRLMTQFGNERRNASSRARKHFPTFLRYIACARASLCHTVPLGQGGTQLRTRGEGQRERERELPSTSAGVYLTVKHFLQEITEVCDQPLFLFVFVIVMKLFNSIHSSE